MPCLGLVLSFEHCYFSHVFPSEEDSDILCSVFPSPEPTGWSLRHTSLKHRGDSKLRTATLGETLLFYPLQATGPCWFQQVPVLDSSQPSQFWPGKPVAAFFSPSSFLSLSCCSVPSFPRLAGPGDGCPTSLPADHHSPYFLHYLCPRGSTSDTRWGDNTYLPICFLLLSLPLEPGNLVRPCLCHYLIMGLKACIMMAAQLALLQNHPNYPAQTMAWVRGTLPAASCSPQAVWELSLVCLSGSHLFLSLFLYSHSETPCLPGPGTFDMVEAGRSEPLQAPDTAMV